MRQEKLTQKYLKEILYYNSITGLFVWRVNNNNRTEIGSIAGWTDSNNYIKIMIMDKAYGAHRLAFLYMEGYFPENDVDHIDRNRVNNKWNNLRQASRSCNVRNSKVKITNTSGITGVCWCRTYNKWRVRIATPKRVHLGRFDNLLDAVKARWEAEVKYGYPNCNSNSSAYLCLKDNKAL